MKREPVKSVGGQQMMQISNCQVRLATIFVRGPFKVPRGPGSSQKDYYKAINLLFAGRTYISPPGLDLDKKSMNLRFAGFF